MSILDSLARVFGITTAVPVPSDDVKAHIALIQTEFNALKGRGEVDPIKYMDLQDRLARIKPTPVPSEITRLENEIQDHLYLLCVSATTIAVPVTRTPPLMVTPTSAHHRSAGVARLYPGLNNASGNCWLNSLMQMITMASNLETAYRTFAEHKLTSGDVNDRRWARVLIDQLNQFKADQAAQSDVSATDTQQIRLAFHHFFRNGLGTPIFSDSPSRHEDAQEGLIQIMKGYEEALIAQGRFSPPPSIYRQVHTIRSYVPTGIVLPTDPAKVELTRRDAANPQAYSVLGPGDTSIKTDPEFQISLPLQDVPTRNPDTLLLRHFMRASVAGETGNYLGADGRLQQYCLTTERTQFATPPEELCISVKRFSSNILGHTSKINDEVPFKQFLTLPREATRSGEEVTMELDSFIVHGGGLTGGHYKSYKKIDGTWIEFNDSGKTVKSDAEINEILKTSYIHHYRRIDRAAIPATYRVGDTASPATVVVPAYQQMVMDSMRQVNIKAADVTALTSLCAALDNGGPINLSSLPEPLQSKFFEQVWLRDHGVPTSDYHYGRNTCMGNPSTLGNPCAPFLSHNGKNLAEQLLNVQKELLAIAEAESLTHKIRAVSEAMQNPTTSQDEIQRLYADLPSEIKATLEAKLYFHHVTKKGKEICDHPKYHCNYGKAALDFDIRSLYDVNKDAFSSISAATPGQPEKLAMLISLLDNPASSNEDLRIALNGLEESLQVQIRGLVYHAHVEKLGREHCRDTDKGLYGTATIASNPRVLLEHAHGSKISLIEDVLRQAQTNVHKLQNHYYQNRLAGYFALQREASISSEKLVKAFDLLDLPKEMKEKFFFLIEQADNNHTPNYGVDKFRRDPRCLSTIVDPLLAGPPLCDKGKNLLEQMIALLGK